MSERERERERVRERERESISIMLHILSAVYASLSSLGWTLTSNMWPLCIAKGAKVVLVVS